MSDERRTEELDEQVEDLDVPAEEGDQVKGGKPLPKISPNLINAAASGQHFKEATITHSGRGS